MTDGVMDTTQIREEEFSQDSFCRVVFLEKQQHLLKSRTNEIVHQHKTHVCPAGSLLREQEESLLLHLNQMILSVSKSVTIRSAVTDAPSRVMCPLFWAAERQKLFSLNLKSMT